MKIKFISPIDKKSYLLFDTFIETFISKGHTIIEDVKDADIVFIDLYSRVGDYDAIIINEVLGNKTPCVIFDGTDYGGMSKETWFGFWEYGYFVQHTDKYSWYEMINYLQYKESKIIYFIRKMDKILSFPTNCYPYELIQYPEHNFPLTTKEELFNREYDFCWIGNESPQRKNIVNGLLKAGFKGYVHWTNEKGLVPHDEWLAKHKDSKLFLTSDGGGFSDERAYQLITIAPMLKQRNNHLQLNPFAVMFDTCLEVSEEPTEKEIEYIKFCLSNKDWLYQIYLNGIKHMDKHYTAEYRANYILSVLNQNGIN